MSFFSNIWQGAKNTVASVAATAVSFVPFVGGALAGKVATQIAGTQILGGSGQPAGDPALAAKIAQQDAMNAAELTRLRQSAADAAAAAGVKAAAAIGPPGNSYSIFSQHPEYLAVGVVVLVLLIVMLSRK